MGISLSSFKSKQGFGRQGIMAINRMNGVMAILLCGMILLGGANVEVEACPQYCLDVEYMTCGNSGTKQYPSCINCCLAPKGCTLHLADGTTQYCG
ncbi:unnamed protein product [Coffea canephora]|uniref:Kazal-like domain-containing protein n=1 Tax=Coffea canephora TaxID=49390 RepID=A0A068UQV4_COFCA|nr:unnamed protein product [Coffea canephora]